MTSNLGVVDTQRLDFVKWQKDSDQKHLVFFFEWESKAVDDTTKEKVTWYIRMFFLKGTENIFKHPPTASCPPKKDLLILAYL